MNDTAAAQLRGHTDDRWVEIERDLLQRVLAAHRPSHPLRAESARGPFAVSEQVLAARLRAAVDRVPRCEVNAIHVRAERAVCTGVTVVITAQYGDPLIPLADAIRLAADDALAAVLGEVRPQVTVTDMHVHVGNIAVGDPKRG